MCHLSICTQIYVPINLALKILESKWNEMKKYTDIKVAPFLMSNN